VSRNLKMPSEYKSIGILMIATNDYIERWKTVAQDLEEVAFKEKEFVSIHLFTNEVLSARAFSEQQMGRIKLTIHEIDGWGWPEATLFRYKFFQDFSEFIKEDFLVYLDSDMRVKDDLDDETKYLLPGDGIGVVRHPGYFIFSKWTRLREYFSNPSIALSDIKSGFRNSWKLGAWETNIHSLAYVPRSHRKTYVHGAIWFGYREDFLALCYSLAQNIKLDLNNNVIAKWHDESHLNNYITKNKHKIFGNRLSYVFGYPQLNMFSQNFIISNVEKNPGEGRSPSNA